ncbi:integrating conjugative element protein (TIGR03765 family) [Pseudomonas oryzihabitans]
MKFGFGRHALFVLGTGWLSLQAVADPLIVVGHEGGVSTQPYFEPFKRIAPPHTATMTPFFADTYEAEAAMLPVRSQRLTPGEASTRALQAPGLSPLFLIGDDEYSRHWLRQQQRRLKEQQAIGLVVNIDTAAALAELRRLAPDLTLIPTSGDDLAQRLGLHHYPVLLLPMADDR